MGAIFSLEIITTVWPLGLAIVLGLLCYKFNFKNLGVILASIGSFLLLVKADLVNFDLSFSTSASKVTCFILLGMLLALIFNFISDKQKLITILTAILSVIIIVLIGYKSIINAQLNDEDVSSSVIWLIIVAVLSLLTIQTTRNSYKNNIGQAVSFIAIMLTYGTLFLFDDLGTSSATLYTFGSILGGYCIINWIIFNNILGNISIMFNMVLVAVVGQSIIYDSDDLNPYLFLVSLIMVFVPNVVEKILPKFIKSEKLQRIILPIIVGGICLVIGGIVMGYAHFISSADDGY